MSHGREWRRIEVNGKVWSGLLMMMMNLVYIFIKFDEVNYKRSLKLVLRLINNYKM